MTKRPADVGRFLKKCVTATIRNVLRYAGLGKQQRVGSGQSAARSNDGKRGLAENVGAATRPLATS